MKQQIQNPPSASHVVIIGGGITGLSIAAKLAEERIPFTLLESKERLGGQIRTCSEKGYVFETGPNTGSLSTPEVKELFEFASPHVELEVANPAAANRWIWKGGRFHALPKGPISAIATPLFTLSDKFRILFEPIRKRGTDPYESIGSLAERRLGKSFVRYAVDPFVGGIYAGDPYSLATKYALPKLYNLEQNYGSFVRGAIRKAREKKDEREKKATKQVFSARGGLQRLVEALEIKLRNSGGIHTEVSAVKVAYRTAFGWEVTFTTSEGDQQTIAASHVVTTIRGDELSHVLPSEISTLLPPIASLVYAPMIELSVGFDHLPTVRRNAFGGLIPSCEGRKLLGILFPSSCFSGRAPYKDSALFTLFMGGMRQGKELEVLSDEEVYRIGLDELYEMMKIPLSLRPDLMYLSRYQKAIPQYDASTGVRVRQISEIQDKFPGLHLAGSVRDGIGLAYRIKQGADVGKKISREINKK